VETEASYKQVQSTLLRLVLHGLGICFARQIDSRDRTARLDHGLSSGQPTMLLTLSPRACKCLSLRRACQQHSPQRFYQGNRLRESCLLVLIATAVITTLALVALVGVALAVDARLFAVNEFILFPILE